MCDLFVNIEAGFENNAVVVIERLEVWTGYLSTDLYTFASNYSSVLIDI